MFRIAKEIFNGTIRGTVSSKNIHFNMSHDSGFISFFIKLDESIDDVPDEIPIFGTAEGSSAKDLFVMHIKEGDKVLVNGKIIRYRLKFWQTEVVRMEADHIYNETHEYGY
ncbi:MAG: hypothetical protein ACTSR3_03030 [Candidatus Helarchaeota archaeon]